MTVKRDLPTGQGLEIWRPVPGYEDWYEASSRGRLRSWYKGSGGRRETPKIIGTGKEGGGYPFACLVKNGKKRMIAVHKVIALTFIGPCPDGMSVNHMDGDKSDKQLTFPNGSETMVSLKKTPRIPSYD